MKSLALPIALLAWTIALTGCHSSKDRQLPEAEIDFPSRAGVTPASSITVRGTASDNGSVTNVSVNGVVASSADGFETWTATVELADGVNSISVDVTDAGGNVVVGAARVDITRRLEIDVPYGYEIDASSDTLYVVDLGLHKIMAVSLDTGDVSEFADLGQFEPTGTVQRPPMDLALDLANNRVFVTVRGTDAVGDSSIGIWAYDTQAGTWSPFSDITIDNSAVLSNPSDVMLDSGNNRLLVLDFDIDAVVAVNLTTGAQSILASNVVPDNTLGVIAEPIDAVFDHNSNRLLLVDRGADAVLAIDLTSGAKSLVTGQGAGSGTALAQPLAMSLDSANNRTLVFDRQSRAIVEIDLSTGERSVFADNATATDGMWTYDVRSLAVSGDDLMVFDNTMDHLLAFDLDTAERRVVTNNGFPRGESLPAMNSLSVVGDDFYGHAYTGFGRVDADNEFELLAGSFDNPNSTTFVYQMAVNPAGTTAYTYEWALVNNVWEPQIKRYDLATGNATVLSSNTVPDSDNGFNYISDMLFDADGNRLIVMAGEQVLAVDAASGARTVVFDDPNMPLVHAWDIAHDVVGDRLLIADTANDYLVAVDLATGAGSQFSTLPVSGETDLSVPVWVSCDENGNLWVLDSDERLLRVDGQTGSRSVLIDVAALDDVFPEYWGEIVSVDGRVFVQSYEGILEIDPESGEFVKVYGTAQSSPGNNT